MPTSYPVRLPDWARKRTYPYREPTTFRTSPTPVLSLRTRIGTFGDTPRNLYAGQGSNNWDLGLGKNFQITERYRLQFRAEAFNAFNRTQFGTPYAVVSAGPVSEGGVFGVVYYIQNAPRVVQFSGKLYF